MRRVAQPLLTLATVLACLGAPPPPAQAQASPPAASVTSPESGRPLLRVYKELDYRGHSQNWAVLRDSDGVLYAGNGQGILIYDGARWQNLSVPSHVVVRSLAIGPDGHIYAGSKADLGYVARDATGARRFVSLLGLVPTADRGFLNVWGTHRVGDRIVFQTYERVFIHEVGSDAPMTVLPASSRFVRSFKVHDRLYVRQAGIGLQTLEGDTLVMAPGGDKLVDTMTYGLLPWDSPVDGPGAMLVVTRTHGLQVLRADGHLRPLEPNLQGVLGAGLVYRGAHLTDGGYALSTLKTGVVLLDAQGRLAGTVTPEDGLPTSRIYGMHSDDEGGLWLAMDRGIARVDWPSTATRFDHRSNLTGKVYSLARHEGRLYACGSEGIHRLDPAASGTEATFVRLTDAAHQVWDLEPYGGELYATAALHGIWRVSSDDRIEVVSTQHAYTLQRMLEPHGDIALLAGTRDGLSTLVRDPDDPARLIDGDLLVAFDQEVKHILWVPGSDPPELWLGLAPAQLARVRDPFGPSPDVRQFGQADGTPPSNPGPRLMADGLRFSSSWGIARLDASGERLVEDQAFGRVVEEALGTVRTGSDGSRGFRRSTALGRDTWIHHDGRTFHLRYEGGQWGLVHGSMPGLPYATVYELFAEEVPDGGRVVWLGGADGLMRVEVGQGTDGRKPPRTLLTAITSPDDRDDRRPLDTAMAAGAAPPKQPAAPLVLPYADNGVRVEYAAAALGDEERTTYQHRLVGFQDRWSPWETERVATFTNLPEGRYVFEVRAQASDGTLGAVTQWPFRIDPPWYRRWWAWIVFALVSASAVTAGVQVRGWQAQRARERLERSIKERTKALAMQAARIVEQREVLSLEMQANERLLGHLLPTRLAAQFKRGDRVRAEVVEEATVVVADLAAVAGLATESADGAAEAMATERTDSGAASTQALSAAVGALLEAFDDKVARRGLSRLEMRGERLSYMVVSGVEPRREDHAHAAVELAQDLVDVAAAIERTGGAPLSVRVGVSSGPVLAGTVAGERFVYDLRGDTVAMAKAMQRTGLPGRVQVSGATQQLVDDTFAFDRRDGVAIQGKGTVTAWIVV